MSYAEKLALTLAASDAKHNKHRRDTSQWTLEASVYYHFHLSMLRLGKAGA